MFNIFTYGLSDAKMPQEVVEANTHQQYIKDISEVCVDNTILPEGVSVEQLRELSEQTQASAEYLQVQTAVKVENFAQGQMASENLKIDAHDIKMEELCADITVGGMGL